MILLIIGAVWLLGIPLALLAVVTICEAISNHRRGPARVIRFPDRRTGVRR